MSLWDDLINSLSSSDNNHHAATMVPPAPAAAATALNLSSPQNHNTPTSRVSHPTLHHVLSSPSAIYARGHPSYKFPPVVPISMARSHSNLELLHQQQQHINNNDNNADQHMISLDPTTTTTTEAVLSPFLRPRVLTWGSAVSDSGCSDISDATTRFNTATNALTSHAKLSNGGSASSAAAVAVVQHHNNGSTSTSTSSSASSKRRATCPDSMRNFSRRPRVGSSSSSSQKRACHKISDNDNSDLSDLDGASTSPSGTDNFTSRLGNIELSIIRQPESHHRARYQKEGSRGCIKDRTGNSCPAIQLTGYTAPLILVQAFIGTETGPVRAHPLYRVCKVGGKHSTPCREKVLEPNIAALEMDLTRDNSFTLNVDCLGIMKLRNADFEQLSEADDATKRRKRSPKVRLVFRALLKLPNGATETLQVVSTPICCTPSPGVPEIHFISHQACAATGGTDVVVIGRNFVKDDSKLFVVEKNSDDQMVWEKEAVLMNENFNQVHLVGSIPAYHDPMIAHPVEVSLCVRNKGGKQSEPTRFKYTPDETILRQMQTPYHLSQPPRSTAHLDSAPQSPLDTKSPLQVLINQNSPHSPEPLATHLHPLSRSNSTSPNQVSQQQQAQHNGMPTPSSSSSSGGNLQYCIQLPGSQQPIIITIPQQNNNNNNHFQYGNNTQQYFDGEMPVTLDLSHLPQQVDSDFSSLCQPNQMAGDGSGSDEDLFNELLREILGNQEVCGDAEMMMMDTSPEGVQTSGGMSASTVRELRNMDINRHGVQLQQQQQQSNNNAEHPMDDQDVLLPNATRASWSR